MKKILAFFALILLFNCSSDDSKDTIDCLFAASDFSVDHSIDSSNSLLVHFTISYDGENTLDDSKIWNFGDGTTQTLTGNQVSHEYSAAGSYSVTVKPTIRNGDAYCSPTLTENVTVN